MSMLDRRQTLALAAGLAAAGLIPARSAWAGSVVRLTSVKAGSVCMAFPFVVRAGHYGDKREESQVAAPRFPGSCGNCECQSASLNLQSWACAVARNPSQESREGLKASDRG